MWEVQSEVVEHQGNTIEMSVHRHPIIRGDPNSSKGHIHSLYGMGLNFHTNGVWLLVLSHPGTKTRGAVCFKIQFYLHKVAD